MSTNIINTIKGIMKDRRKSMEIIRHRKDRTKYLVFRYNKKYTMIVREVYDFNTRKKRFLVQFYSKIPERHIKVTEIYGLYDSFREIREGLEGKYMPDPWQGERAYVLRELS